MPSTLNRRDSATDTGWISALSGVRRRLRGLQPSTADPALDDSLPERVLDLVSDPTVLVDAQGSIRIANRAARDAFGALGQGEPLEARLDIDHREEYRTQLALSAAGESTTESQAIVVRPDGAEARVLLTVSPLANSAPPLYAVRLRDPGPDPEVAEAQARRRTLHVVLNALPDPVVAVDRSGRVLFRNQASTRQISPETEAALPAHEWHAADAVMRTGVAAVGEEPDAGGGIRLTTRIPVTSRTGGVIGLVAISRDVTSQKASQARLLDAARVAEASARAGGEVLAMTSHEVRTLMSGVAGMTALLLDTDLDADQRDFVETIRSSSDSLLRVVNDVLDMSKMDAGMLELEHQPYDLRRTVKGALAVVAHQAREKGLALAGTVDRAVPGLVAGDSGRVQQVLANLLTNAVKFTEQGSVQVHVEAAAGPAPALVFSVEDTGIGIEPDRLDAVFEPFAQADASTARTHGGTGLGLTICRRLVGMMGGELTAESAPGGGSVFRFTVALDASPAQDPPAEELPAQQPPAQELPVQEQPAEEPPAEQAPIPDAPPSAVTPEPLAAEAAKANAAEMENEVEANEPAPLEMLLATDLTVSPQAPPPPVSLTLSDPALAAPADVVAPPAADDVAEGPHTPNSRTSKVMDMGSILPSASVLLVEDDPVMQKVTGLTLRRLGYRPTVVDNGSKGVLAARSARYDVILMDVMMPVMDGLEATRRIRAATRPDEVRPAIVALTANALDGDRQRCLDAGCDDYLSKPVAPAELAATIERAIREQQDAASAEA